MSLGVNFKGDSIEYFCEASEDLDFNLIIGAIEDILITEKFLALQQTFMEKYWQEFEDTEENKLVYTEIFNEYQDTIESYIEKYLQETIIGFSMEKFSEELLKRKKELDGEIFEVLFTFTDFLRFKEMFLDYKAMKEGRTVDLSENMTIQKL